MILKRCFDVVLSGLLMILLLPIFVLVTFALVATSGFPVIYRASRVGRGGQSFEMLKFRTMGLESGGPAITAGDDPRITPFGAVLRRTKIDEIPQLINVLRGDMSLVGPRPEDSRFVLLYSSEQREVLTVRPGITSPAAIRYRHEQKLLGADDPNLEDFYMATIMPAKLAIDLDYVRRRTFWRDVVILFQSLVAVLHLEA